jgi:hypothetical protein
MLRSEIPQDPVSAVLRSSAVLLIVEKLDALLNGLTRRDIERLTPEQRKRLALALRRIADIADRPERAKPKVGVLYDLGRGERAH